MTIELTTLEGQTKTITGEETYKTLFEAICKSDFEMLDNEHIAEVSSYSAGSDPKEALRNFAKEYQRAQAELSTSYAELAFWSGFFETYGAELGLLEEFKENGII